MKAIKLLCGDDPRTCEMWGVAGKCEECQFAEPVNDNEEKEETNDEVS